MSNIMDQPISSQLADFLATTRATRVWLRSDLFWQVSDELCGPDKWISSLNDIPVYFGKKHGEKR